MHPTKGRLTAALLTLGVRAGRPGYPGRPLLVAPPFAARYVGPPGAAARSVPGLPEALPRPRPGPGAAATAVRPAGRPRVAKPRSRAGPGSGSSAAPCP